MATGGAGNVKVFMSGRGKKGGVLLREGGEKACSTGNPPQRKRNACLLEESLLILYLSGKFRKGGGKKVQRSHEKAERERGVPHHSKKREFPSSLRGGTSLREKDQCLDVKEREGRVDVVLPKANKKGSGYWKAVVGEVSTRFLGRELIPTSRGGHLHLRERRKKYGREGAKT